MSEVKKFRADHRHVVETEFDDAQYVGIADFDTERLRAETAEAELAALREENRVLQKQLGERWFDIAALREELEKAEQDIETLVDADIESQQRLAAAEQRNVDQSNYLREALKRINVNQHHAFCLALDDFISSAISKPTESGASGLTCNQIREESGLPINKPCTACNNGACIDK